MAERLLVIVLRFIFGVLSGILHALSNLLWTVRLPDASEWVARGEQQLSEAWTLCDQVLKMPR